MKKCPRCGKEYETTNTLCPNDGEVLVKANDALIGTTLAEKYRIEGLISEGGMGAVYRGTHVLMDKTVAVKVLHPSLAADEKIVARFSREARAASRITHPHALTVTDFGESEDGIVFLVMEHLDGQTLKEVIRSEGPLPIQRVVTITKQISGALDAAHAEGVVHRDLKSDNIMMVSLQDRDDWAKVLDFGIAKIQEPLGQDPELTAPNLIIGTPQYMSPEQCSQSAEIDARSDIYSFGVIIFEMLTGHVPFTGESPTAIMMKQIQDPPPLVRDERTDIPVAVDSVVQKALAKDPENRYQSACELSDALSAAAESEAAISTDAEPVVTSHNGERNTDRIIAGTGGHSPSRVTVTEEVVDERDEETVVRPKSAGFAAASAASVAQSSMRGVQAPPSGIPDIWKVIIPSIAGLLVVFAVVYALTGRKSTAANSNQNTSLVSDPNGRAVQPGSAPTGDAEKGIISSLPAVTPTPSPATAPYVPPGEAQKIANTNLGPGEIGIVNEQKPEGNTNTRNANARNPNSQGASGQENSNRSEASANPSPSPKNSNNRVAPPPPLNQNGDDEKPSLPKSKPTPPPPIKPDPASPNPPDIN